MNSKDHPNNIRDFYSKIGSNGLHKMTEIDHRLDWEVPLLNKLFSECKPGPLLDVGCGNGRVSIPLAEHGFIIDGLDLVPDFILEANKEALSRKVECQFFVNDAFHLQNFDKLYKGIFMMWGTFRHILEKDRQVELLKILLKHMDVGGILLVDTIDEERLSCAENLDNKFQKRLDNEKQGVVKVFHKDTNGITYAFQFTEDILYKCFISAGFSKVYRLEVEKDLSRLVIVGVK